MHTASSRSSVLAILAITVIGLSAAVVPAQAGTVIPWLTGSWDVIGGQGLGYVSPLNVNEPPFGSVNFSVTANLTHTTQCFDLACFSFTQGWSGPIVSGTFDWGGFSPPYPNVSPNGWLTGGEQVGFWIVSLGITQGYGDYYYNVGLGGIWSNDLWWSEGSGRVNHDATIGAWDGFFTITTFTPEPGSISLLLAGGLAVGRTWSRRSRKR